MAVLTIRWIINERVSAPLRPRARAARTGSLLNAQYARCILVSMAASETPDLDEFLLTALAPPDLADRAEALVKKHPECFWFWRSEARIRTLEDVRLVIQHLREYGDRRAWQDAQDL